jgi:hypothetical protein
VVEVADDELFGPDGTQPSPAPPFLSDPLAGLVTGALFADTTAGPEFEVAGPYLNTNAATSPARRPRARTTPARATQGRPLQAATSPDAIPVAAPLSARSATQHAVRPNPTAPARITPIRPAPPRVAPATWQPPRTARPGTPGRPAPAPASARRTRRRAGAGCSFFLVLIVIVVIAFVVLGIVLGRGTGGFGLGGG